MELLYGKNKQLAPVAPKVGVNLIYANYRPPFRIIDPIYP